MTSRWLLVVCGCARQSDLSTRSGGATLVQKRLPAVAEVREIAVSVERWERPNAYCPRDGV